MQRLTKSRSSGIVVLRCNNFVTNVTVGVKTGGTHEIHTGESRNLCADSVGDHIWFGSTRMHLVYPTTSRQRASGLVLDERLLSSVQEEAVQEERTAETVQEAEEAPAVTSEDIESGMTGVGESAIDTEVVSHVQEQQVEAAIANGVGVASVLNAAAPESAPAASGTEVALTAGVESAVNVLPSAAAGIVEPVSLSALQGRADNTSSEQPEEQTSMGSDPEPVSEQPSETTS